MQVKNEPQVAIEQDHKVSQVKQSHEVDASNKTHDVKKQAEQQQDKGREWEKFANNAAAHTPSNINDVAAQKQVEASRESSRLDIEAKLRETGIKA